MRSAGAAFRLAFGPDAIIVAEMKKYIKSEKTMIFVSSKKGRLPT